MHGDVHQWNALQAAGGGFKLVDPDGLLAEAEYDLGILMREDPEGSSTATRAGGRDGWPHAAASMPPRSGSGAWPSGWRPGSS